MVIVLPTARPDDIPDPLGGGDPLPRPPTPSLRAAAAAPDRSQVERRRHAALVLSLGWFFSHLLVFGARPDLRALSRGYLLAHVAAPLLLAVASLWVATRPGRWGLGTRPRWTLVLAVAGPLSFGLISLAMPAPHGVGEQLHPWLAALLCSDLMLAWMSAPLFAAALTLRGAFAAGAVWRSALIGSSVGLGSAVSLNLHCSNGHPFHLIVGHGVPIVASSLLAAFVVSRWLRA